MIYNLIKQLIQTVYNFIRRNNNNEEIIEDEHEIEEEESPEHFPVAVFEASLLENGNLAIACGWSQEYDEIAIMFGHMLAMLNQGAFKQDIITTLSQKIAQDKSKAEFISKILLAWESSANSEPMKPSEVFVK